MTRGSENVPDLSGHLEKTLTDSNFQKPLSDEAYSRFRKALGKLLWLSQVRHDLKTWMSVLGTQQAKPMHGTEQALKAILRFLYVDMHACLCLPSRDETIMSQVDDAQLRSVHLHSFSDASHAPYRFNNCKGVSGGAVFFERSLVRSLSRQQQALSLSSCEIRLHWLREQMREVAKVQSSGTLSRVAVCIRQWKNSSSPPWVHIHASTPCGSGSPLRNFNPNSVTEKDQF